MKLTDLKLLVDCALADEKGAHAGYGFISSAKRLVQRGLVEGNPTWLGMVRITKAGNALIEKLLEAGE